jgi:hypothetical protein
VVAGTVHVPCACHPVALPVVSVADMKTFFVPAYPPSKVIARFSVSVFDPSTRLLLLRLTKQLEFCRIPPLPGVPDTHCTPAESSRDRVFVGGE